MKVLLLFIAFATKQNTEGDGEIFEQNANSQILVKIEEDEYAKVKYIGVYYNETKEKWIAQRRSKNEKKNFYNGHYKDEETAAHASDTLARKLMANGEQNLKLNFPDDGTEVYVVDKVATSKFIGVSYDVKTSKWAVMRWSKNENKAVYDGAHKDEETAAHASDTLARKLMANGEQNHKLNFPNDDTEVYLEKKTNTSKYIGVTFRENRKKSWQAQRWSKNERKMVNNGSYKDDETAAHASDTLARKLIANGEQNHKLNFPGAETELHPERRNNKRKRSDDLGVSQTDGNFSKFE